ncbi:MAG: CARDB domain-containing protein [archaeon]
MRKQLVYFIFAILLLADALAIGVAPSRNEIFFEAGAKKEGIFRIINSELKDMNIAIYAKGALMNNIKFAESKIHLSSSEAEKTIHYDFILPYELPVGDTVTEIFIVELSDNSDSNMVKANIGVIHKLIVKVPYPDQYLQGILFIGDARPNEETTFTVTLANLGTKDINKIKGQIIIKDFAGNAKAKIDTNEISLAAGKKGKVTAVWIPNLNSGNYIAEALVEYDNSKILSIEKEFDLGEPLLDITELRVGTFKLGSIAKFDILVKSNWNSQINDIYANTEMRTIDGAIIDTYKTPSAIISAYSTQELNYFWDSKDSLEGEYIILAKVNYLGRVREKTYLLNVKSDKIIIRPDAATGFAVEQAKPAGDKTGLLIGVVILLVIIIIVLLTVKLKARGGASSSKEETSANLQLKGFIRAKLKEGISVAAIRDNLIKKGWKKEIIDRIILEIEDES